MKYQYTYIRCTGDFKQRLDELNAAGEQGWKVEGMEVVNNDTVAYLMSREIQES